MRSFEGFNNHSSDRKAGRYSKPYMKFFKQPKCGCCKGRFNTCQHISHKLHRSWFVQTLFFCPFPWINIILPAYNITYKALRLSIQVHLLYIQNKYLRMLCTLFWWCFAFPLLQNRTSFVLNIVALLSGLIFSFFVSQSPYVRGTYLSG